MGITSSKVVNQPLHITSRNIHIIRLRMQLTLVSVLVVALSGLCSCENTPPPPPKDHDLSQYTTTEEPQTEISGRIGGSLGGRVVNCFDSHRNGGYWSARGFCYNSFYRSYMRRSCRRSCNSCSGGLHHGGFNNGGFHNGGFHNNRYNRRW